MSKVKLKEEVDIVRIKKNEMKPRPSAPMLRSSAQSVPNLLEGSKSGPVTPQKEKSANVHPAGSNLKSTATSAATKPDLRAANLKKIPFSSASSVNLNASSNAKAIPSASKNFTPPSSIPISASREKPSATNLGSLRSPSTKSVTPGIVSLEDPITVLLRIHDARTSSLDLILSASILPSVPPGTLVMIYDYNQPLDTRLFLQLTAQPSNNPLKSPNEISLARRIAQRCGLEGKSQIIIQIVNDQIRNDILIERLELSLENQYIGRADMFQVKDSLSGACVHIGFAAQRGQMRVVVNDIYVRGQQSLSGVVDSRTKFIFRSKSAKIFIMVQMSKEMWNFASDGDLQFERAVNGFLRDLFHRWLKAGVTHSVTIILFSRIFENQKDTATINSPVKEGARRKSELEMKSAALEQISTRTDAWGRKYRDFFKVVIDAESMEDFTPVITILKREFTQYHKIIHRCGQNSSAQQGNFLEALSLAMNVFDNHYIDRELDRLGQQIIVISPGIGLFEVDRELRHLTKQRMVDLGIGCNLICLGEPPLHAVPLFMMNTPITEKTNPLENCFYKRKKNDQNVGQSMKWVVDENSPWKNVKWDTARNLPIPFENVWFKVPHWIYIGFYSPVRAREATKTNIQQLHGRMPGLSLQIKESLNPNRLDPIVPSSWSHWKLVKAEGDEIPTGGSSSVSSWKSYSQIIPTDDQNRIIEQICKEDRIRTVRFEENKDCVVLRIWPSKGVNPFVLQQNLSKPSSNRRRWAHLFPQSHTPAEEHALHVASRFITLHHWHSMTQPALLPLTTDYFPDDKKLAHEYLGRPHTLSLAPGEDNPYEGKTEDLVRELVSQRLIQNFQLVVMDSANTPTVVPKTPNLTSTSQNMKWNPRTSVFDKGSSNFYLSLGRMFHRITYNAAQSGGNISVTSYFKSTAGALQNPKYTYCLWPANAPEAIKAKVRLVTSDPFLLQWNSIDQLICGSHDVHFARALPYWRISYAIIPGIENQQTAGGTSVTNTGSNLARASAIQFCSIPPSAADFVTSEKDAQPPDYQERLDRFTKLIAAMTKNKNFVCEKEMDVNIVNVAGQRKEPQCPVAENVHQVVLEKYLHIK